MASTALPPPPASAPGGGPPPASIMLAASAAAICRRRRQRNNNKCIAFEAAGRRVLIDVPDRKGVEESRYTGELGGFFSPPDHPYPCPWRWRQARSGPARRLLAQQKGSKRRWCTLVLSAPPALPPSRADRRRRKPALIGSYCPSFCGLSGRQGAQAGSAECCACRTS